MSDEPNAEEFVDIATALGADGGVSTQCFSIYVPNKDRHGVEIGNQPPVSLGCEGAFVRDQSRRHRYAGRGGGLDQR